MVNKRLALCQIPARLVSPRTTTHLAQRHVVKSERTPLHNCRQATAIESRNRSALLIIVLLGLDSSLLALLRPLGRLGLLLRGLRDLLLVVFSIVILGLSGSSSFLALLLLGNLGSLLLRNLRGLLPDVVLASGLSLVVVLGLSDSLALLGSGSSAVGGFGIYVTEKKSISKNIIN